MTIHILTTDLVKAEELGAYIGQDWSGAPNIRAGWSVAFGPVTRIMFLQGQDALEPPPPPMVPPAFSLERRERQWLRARSPHRPTPADITVLELRTYSVRTGLGDRFLDLMLGALPLRQRYSPNFGVWSSLSGRLEQVLHLWGYRSLDERAAVRARLKEDREWDDYTATILPMLEELQSVILTPLPKC
ncbi:NIPSNAP family protein [Sphingomonas sp. YL-JM2C]